MSVEDRYPSYRVPQSDGEILCVPSEGTIHSTLERNSQHVSNSSIQVAGVPLAELSRQARRELLLSAQKYTGSYLNLGKTLDENQPIVLTGHQPEFVHPGVWLKNFAATKIAEYKGGTSIDLVIDNDLCRSTSVRVPTGTIDQPQTVDVPFDQPHEEISFEERTILDRTLWNSFGERITKAISSLVPEPLISQWWAEATEQAAGVPQLGLAISQTRHRLEYSWGSCGLQIPQSVVCQSTSFRRFAVHLLGNADQLRRNYNDSLAEYRKVHRLRNSVQPMPDLAEVEGWIETPFWIWTSDNPHRRALYIRLDSSGLMLSDRQQWQERLPNGTDDQLQQLEQWEEEGTKLRTRALITTLYARLVLSDTFIHGIGGAKYDQVTDVLCHRLFGIQPPPYIVISGTLRLPIEHTTIPSTRVNEIRQELRNIRYHPETFLDSNSFDQEILSQAETWIALKSQWVETAKSVSNAAQRHAQIAAANENLLPLLEERRSLLENELSTCLAQTRKNRLLESREYPFCLFPSQFLRQFLLDFSLPIP